MVAGSHIFSYERVSEPGVFILVRRLGFAPGRVLLDGRDSLTIALTAVALPLPVLAVETKALRCPSTSEPEAEQLLAATASRYAPGATQLYFTWIGSRLQETVSAEQRGYGDGSEFRTILSGGIQPVTGEHRAIALREPPPYAVYERKVSLGGEFRRWRYAPLENAAAEHFILPSFQARHSFVILGRAADATVIGFCPRERAEASISGELQIGADSLMRAARWSVRVAHDDEDAGGEITLGSTPFEGARYLVALRGSTWRRAGQGRYNQDRFELIRWQLGRTALDAHIQSRD